MLRHNMVPQSMNSLYQMRMIVNINFCKTSPANRRLRNHRTCLRKRRFAVCQAGKGTRTEMTMDKLPEQPALRRTPLDRDDITAAALWRNGGQSRQVAGGQAGLQPDDTVLKGRLVNDRPTSHFRVHTTDTVAMRDFEISNFVHPAVTVAIVVDGRVEGAFDDEPFDFDARHGVVGYMWALPHAVTLTRRIPKHNRVRKVMVTARFDWVEKSLGQSHGQDAIRAFLTGDHGPVRWQPSRRAVALAEQMLYPPIELPLFREIYIESRGLEIFGEALRSVMETPQIEHNCQAASVDVTDKAQEIRDYITHHMTSGLSLRDLATAMNMSVARLQRLFKTAYGTTVMDFMRETRLQTARDAMDKDGLTIGQAAYLAGYSSPANFATAFKRVFGISPSEARER
ncbi:AraC family transcriptional regulator [Thalassospira marina]|uniref:AraC family transcriptional regulator n=2 Tax=Thalassospira marina TaxID=2048283 RepID=A0ABM6QAG4_9PROT|nr:AraC family transcriptional regulator [Thalassospira marina]